MTAQFPVTDAAAEAALTAIEASVAAGATAANQTSANTSLATIATAQGASGTGITQPTGGGGLLGWLSGIYRALVNTLAVADENTASVPGRVALTVGTPATAGRSFCAICTVAGNVAITFADTSVGVYPIAIGINIFPFQVTQVNTSGTTATATYENWK